MNLGELAKIHLVEVDWRIAGANVRISHQIARIEQIALQGRDTTESERTLALFVESLRLLHITRAHILDELKMYPL